MGEKVKNLSPKKPDSGYITMIVPCPLPAASASAVHCEVPITSVYTCSDICVLDLYYAFLGVKVLQSVSCDSQSEPCFCQCRPQYFVKIL